jgi:hypothetical protein
LFLFGGAALDGALAAAAAMVRTIVVQLVEDATSS